MDDIYRTVDLFESASITNKTQIIPELSPLPNRKPQQYYFVYPRTPEVMEAAKEYALGATDIHSFIKSYKFLRQLLYQKIGKGELRNE
jgi:hypothetical protein